MTTDGFSEQTETVCVWTSAPKPWTSITSLLSAQEVAYVEGTRRIERANEFATARAMIRLATESLRDVEPSTVVVSQKCECGSTSHGQPRVNPELKLHVSITHCASTVAIALASRPVGIDVESKARANIIDAIAIALSESELRAITDVDPGTRHSASPRYWVRKEALLKATGYGLAIPPSTMTMSHHQEAAELLQWVDGKVSPGDCAMQDLSLTSDTIACVAVLSPTLLNVTVVEAFS